MTDAPNNPPNIPRINSMNGRADGLLSALFNGQPVDAVSVTSRGLQYGDGVFRTMLKVGGRLIDETLQLAKLRADAAALALEAPPASLLREELERTSIASADCTLKLLLMRAGSTRGYTPRGSDADRLLMAYPPPPVVPARYTQGINAIRSPVTMASQPLLAGIKHLNRLEQVLASRDWPADVDEALLGDERGAPVCGTRSNIFWVQGGRLFTPTLDRAGVAGVLRGKLLALAVPLGVDCRIGAHPWASLLAADEAFVCNSLIGIWPLRMLDEHRYAAPGPVTQRLMRAVDHPTLRLLTVAQQ